MGKPLFTWGCEEGGAGFVSGIQDWMLYLDVQLHPLSTDVSLPLSLLCSVSLGFKQY